jgi:Ras-related protein Rab-2A
VYDVTSRKSMLPFPPTPSHNDGNLHLSTLLGFENTRSWLADVREHADPHLTCILVGNKVDLVPTDDGDAAEGADLPTGGKPRAVPREEAERFAKEEDLLFVEASAKSGANVEKAFEDACKDILDKIRRGVFDDDRVRHSDSMP